jgi:hypothetical protein
MAASVEKKVTAHMFDVTMETTAMLLRSNNTDDKNILGHKHCNLSGRDPKILRIKQKVTKIYIQTFGRTQQFVRIRFLQLLGWGHTSAQNASVALHVVTSVVEIERNQ